MPVQSLNNAPFKLDSSGVAGFFGGEEAVGAMATVCFHRWQKWLGWYNSPGSYAVARQYGKVANNRFWDALFPGEIVEPAEFFGLDGESGPEFIANGSWTHLKATGHIAYFMVKAARAAQKIDVPPKYVMGNRSRPTYMTVVDLKTVQEMSPALLQRPSLWAAFGTILLSIAPCVACGVFDDWYCFAMILLGVISNGLSCFVIGSGELQFHKPNPALSSPPGDGILIDGSEVIILRGMENTVGAVTSGKFKLRYSGAPEYRAISVCSLFQYAQSLTQLLLIPQGTLFGQIMFLTTFVASWFYNCYLRSLDKEQLQLELVMKVLNQPRIRKFGLQTRATMIVLALLIPRPPHAEDVLDQLLPKGSPAWITWRDEVLKQYRSATEFNFDISKIDALTKEGGLLINLY